MPDIIYTKVDEAPELASASFLPILQKFSAAAGVTIGTKDISLAGRILAAFPDHLSEDQRQPDDLAELGRLVKTPDANVIKLPNISASVPQLVAAIKELQAKGYALPDYPEAPQTEAEKAVRAKYDAIKGSAVNPVLREGNSDRRAAKAVKNFAQNNPHRMGDWSADSKTRVSSMSGSDFFSNEKSATLAADTTAKIVLETASDEIILKDDIHYTAGTVVDATFMSAAALKEFLAAEIESAKSDGTLFSLHLKSTMMKVSDPIIFGHAVKTFLAPVFEAHGDTLAAQPPRQQSGADRINNTHALPSQRVGRYRARVAKGWIIEYPPIGLFTLVPDDTFQRLVISAMHEIEIRGINRACQHPHPHLAGAWLRNHGVNNADIVQVPGERAELGRFHTVFLHDCRRIIADEPRPASLRPTGATIWGNCWETGGPSRTWYWNVCR